jgi:hypothetical protein
MTGSTLLQPALPMLMDDTGVSGDNITNIATPEISGTADADTLITLYDTDGVTVLGTTTTDLSGTWRVNASHLVDGAHALSVTVGDGAGGVSAASPLLNIIVDTLAPDAPGAPMLATGMDTGASSTDGITRIYMPTLTGTAEAYSSVTVFSSDGATTIGHGTADASGIYTIELQNAISGINHLLVQATDAAGNVSALSTPGAAIIVDDDAPDAPTALTLDPASDSGVPGDLVTSARSVLIHGHAEAGATMTMVESGGTAVLGTAVADADGNWQIRTIQLDLGDHVLSVTATDLAGNVSSSGTSLALTIVPPQIPPAPTALLDAASDSGAPGDGISNVNTPTVTGIALANAIVTLYDHDGSEVGTAVAGADGAWSITSAKLDDGVHALSATQTDPVGGGVSPASAALILNIDTLAPGALSLSNSSIAIDAAADAVVGYVHAVDDGIGNLKYALVSGAGDDANAAFTLVGDELHVTDAAALGLGDASLRIRVTDAAGNSYDQALIVTVAAGSPPGQPDDPDQPDAPDQPPSTVDGVPVSSKPVTLPGGGHGNAITIPVIVSGSIDNGTGVADIPLFSNSAGALLTAHLPAGAGLVATGGPSATVGQSAGHLQSAIAASGFTSGEQPQAASFAGHFLDALPDSASLQLATIALQRDAGAVDPEIRLSGNAGAHSALVIDASKMQGDGHVVLEHIDFAAVVGTMSVSGDTAGQMLTGDAASQHFSVTGSGSQVAAGGGNDIITYADATARSVSVLHAQQATAAPAPIVLDGGTGVDMAMFGKAEADYTVTRYDGHVVVVDQADPAQQIWVSNVETLHFADASMDLVGRTELSTLAGMYQSVLGRQADIGGFEFWGQAQQSGAATLGQVALDLIGSTEGAARGYHFTGDATHDVDVLYQALFGRAADAAGEAFWVQAVHDGHGLAEVAQNFVTSVEIVGHQIAATAWNLHY